MDDKDSTPRETVRQAALRALKVPDLPPIGELDRITRLALRLFNVPVSTVSLIDSTRAWLSSRLDPDAPTPAREITFYGHTIRENNLLVLPQAHAESRFHNVPLAIDQPKTFYYSGHPIRSREGHVLGTLCIGDDHPLDLSPEDNDLLQDLAALAEHYFQRLEFGSQVQAIREDYLKTESLFETFFTRAAVGIAVLSPTGEWLRVNRKLCDTLDYNEEQLVGHRLQEITHPEDLKSDFDHIGRLLTGQIPDFTMEKRFRRGDGIFTWVSVTVALVRDEADQPLYFALVLQCIDTRKGLEEEVRKAQRELEARVAQRTAELLAASRAAAAARLEAEKANQVKSEFLATMSHEIRTPLNAVIGLNSLLINSPLNAEQRQQVELARQAGENLLQLINDFLDFTKIEGGFVELERLPFAPETVLNETLALVRDSVDHKGVGLLSEIVAPSQLEGDPSRLRQILLNLLSNAVKFTTQGQIVLRCHEIAGPGREPAQDGQPSPPQREPDGVTWLRMEVADTGIGIPPDQQQDLFMPFTQGDSSTTRRFGGTGLGLAICAELTHLMGGRIGVRSTPGQGSLFWVELPFRRSQNRPADTPADLPAADADAFASGECHVLLVEDNPTNQLMTQTMLTRMGCDVDVAANGLEAVTSCQREPYDLVLMDCDMPLMDGYAATRTIREQQGPNQDVPIVALTAAAISGDREKCLAAGMDDYLAKPIRLRELDRTVHRLMRRH
ncbi:MAG: putative Histidine kinase (modular protein) [Moraxellaceae bacterium]|jgi:PAS domain S-box-containing protein|nr:putative Histidine kinase (modular protein) [Moraxellaceae bacterium]